MDVLANRQYFKRVYIEYTAVYIILLGFTVIPPIITDIPHVLFSTLGFWCYVIINKGKGSGYGTILFIYLIITGCIYILQDLLVNNVQSFKGIVTLGTAFLPLCAVELYIALDRALTIQKLLGFCDYDTLLYIKRYRKKLQAIPSTSLSDEDKIFVCQYIETALFVMYPKSKRIGLCYIISLLSLAGIFLGLFPEDIIFPPLAIGVYALCSTFLMGSEIL